MSSQIFTRAGSPIVLSSKVGEGGEAAVFALSNDSNTVVKLYLKPPRPEQAAKLQAMIAMKDRALTDVAAWPLDLVFNRSQQLVGYTMPRLRDQSSIHDLFGPKRRQRLFPNATWKFLVHTAKNVAGGFVVLHARNVVVGDVNPNNIVVYGNSLIRLLDADSFAFTHNGELYRCDVGMGEYQPKELQGINLSLVPRTQEHDLFGLAVIIFQLCMLGKHPFEGVLPAAAKAGLTREDNIQAGRYFYDRDAQTQGLKTPPGSLTTGALSPQVAAFFERAFRGAPSQRPQALEWFDALDTMENGIVTCPKNKMHTILRGLTCPWCALEAGSGIAYFLAAVPVTVSGTIDDSIWRTFSNEQVTTLWQAVVALGKPPTPYAPTGHTSRIVPKPVPAPLRAKAGRFVGVMGAILIIGIALLFTHWPTLGLFVLFVACGVWPLGRPRATMEIHERDVALEQAKVQFDAAEAEWARLGTGAGFADLRAQVEQLANQLRIQRSQHDAEVAALEKRAREMQLRKYLDSHLIADAKIKGVGQKLADKLAAWNIETALDVDYNRVLAVHGIGPSKASALDIWRRSVERAFRFDPKTGVDQSSVREIAVKYVRARAQLRDRFLGGKAQLEALMASVTKDAAKSQARAIITREKFDQARADRAHLPSLMYRK